MPDKVRCHLTFFRKLNNRLQKQNFQIATSKGLENNVRKIEIDNCIESIRKFNLFFLLKKKFFSNNSLF